MEEINIIHNASLPGQMEISLLFYGKQACPPDHAWGPGLRDTYILHYVHSGQGVFRSGGSEYRLSAGQGFVILPDTLVHYSADTEDPWTYTWFGFQGMMAKPLLQRAQIGTGHPVFTACADSGFSRFFEELKSVQDTRGNDMFSLGILYQMMADLIRSSPEDDAGWTARNTKEIYIRKAAEYISSSYSRKISVLDIARSVGLDRTYLSGLFKEQYGVSLQTFLLEYRMNRASELLRNPELSVGDVSRSVGYGDPFLFSKMFKKTIGVSPRQYRANLK